MPFDTFSAHPGAAASVDLHVPLLLGVLDGLNHGLILATPEGRPLFVNHSARRLLAEGDGITLSGGRLCGSAPRDTERFRSGLDAAMGGAEGRVWLHLSRADGRRPILAAVSPARTPDALGMVSRVVTIVLRDCDVEAAIDAQALAEAYKLTRRESAVAALVAEGKDPRGAARMLDLGVGTVRNHLKRVFDKMGVTKQSQLAFRAYAAAGAQA